MTIDISGTVYMPKRWGSGMKGVTVKIQAHQRKTVKVEACRIDIAPLAIGRDRVLFTRRSTSASTMSFQAHPTARRMDPDRSNSGNRTGKMYEGLGTEGSSVRRAKKNP